MKNFERFLEKIGAAVIIGAFIYLLFQIGRVLFTQFI